MRSQRGQMSPLPSSIGQVGGGHPTPVLRGSCTRKVVPMLVYEAYVSVFDWGFGAAMAMILLGLTLAITAVYTRLLRTV